MQTGMQAPSRHMTKATHCDATHSRNNKKTDREREKRDRDRKRERERERQRETDRQRD
jgi:hypothetical protein